MVRLGVLAWCVHSSGQVDGLQRAGCRVGGSTSVDTSYPVQAVMVQVFILEDRGTCDLRPLWPQNQPPMSHFRVFQRKKSLQPLAGFDGK